MAQERPFIDKIDELKILHMVIEEKIHDSKSIPDKKKNTTQLSEKKKNNDQINQTNAAIIIQDTWRTSLIAEKFSKDFYASYLKILSYQRETDFLAELMFGRTIADVTKNQAEFPQNPNKHSNPAYHRADDLSTSELYKSTLSKFAKNPDLQKYEYIPVLSLANAPVEQIIDTHFQKNKFDIFILKLKDEPSLCFLKVNKASLFYRATVEKITSLGIIASPWELNIFHAKHSYQNLSQRKIMEKDDTITNVISHLPTNFLELKDSKLMTQLARLSLNKKNSTHLLAASLHRLIYNLPERKYDPEIIQRIFIFLSIAVKFYKNNYERFSIALYSIVHEISLILYDEMSKNNPIVTFEQFKKDMLNHCIASFGLDKKDNPQYQFIVSPSISGCSAFTIAMSLANKMKTSSNRSPSIKLIGPHYYEFESLIDRTNVNDPADIYLVSSGPIMDTKCIAPGIDINKLVKERILPYQPISKFITIVVDSTTGFYQDLKLHPSVSKLVEDGYLSIIVHQSHQKFHLLHTDEAQYGSIFGVCSKNAYSLTSLKEFEQNSEKDLANHLDLQVGAYISGQCGIYIEKIKEKHFYNGSIFKDFLTKLKLTKIDEYLYKEMLEKIDKLYFFYISKRSPFIKPFETHFEERNRGSFGHFFTSSSPVGDDLIRIAPNASDTIDSLLDATQLYISCKWPPKKIVTILADWIKEITNNPNYKMSTSEEIIFTGLLVSLKKEKFVNFKEQFSILTALDLALKLNVNSGRNTFQELINLKNQFYQNKDFDDLATFFKKITSHYQASELIIKSLYGIKDVQLVKAIIDNVNKTDVLINFLKIFNSFGKHSILFLLNSENYDLYIKQLPSYEKFNLLNLINEKIYLVNNNYSEIISQNIKNKLNEYIVADFKNAYSNQCKFSFLGDGPFRSNFGSKVLNDQIKSIEEVTSYVNSHTEGAAARALEKITKK